MTFGEKLLKLRKGRGWTQEELATKINVSRQALSKWEQGTALPDTENVLQVSRLFGVSTDYLLNDDYESDGDIPAVQTTGERLQRRLNRVVGLAISYLGVIGFVALAVVGANYSEEYPMTQEGVVTTARGLHVLLERYNLYWLAALLLAAIVAGVLVGLLPNKKR